MRSIRFGAALLILGVLLSVGACAGKPNDSDAELAASRAVNIALEDHVEALGLDYTVYGTVTEEESDTDSRFTLLVTYEFPGTDEAADQHMRDVAREVWFAYPNELTHLRIEGYYDNTQQPWRYILSPQDLEGMYGPRPDESPPGWLWITTLVAVVAAVIVVAAVFGIGRGRQTEKKPRRQAAKRQAVRVTPVSRIGARGESRDHPAQTRRPTAKAETAKQEHPSQPRQSRPSLVVPVDQQPLGRPETSERSPDPVRRRRDASSQPGPTGNRGRRRRSSAESPNERAFAFQNAYADLDRLAPPRTGDLPAHVRDRLIADKVRARPEDIRRLRRLRNAIAHAEDYSDDDVRDALKTMTILRSRLSKRDTDTSTKTGRSES